MDFFIAGIIALVLSPLFGWTALFVLISLLVINEKKQ